jgi:carboxymethylenebutenolidase
VIQFEMAQVMTPDTEQSKLFWHIIETIKPADMADDCVAAVVSAQQDPAAAPGSAGVIGLCHTARTVIHALADHGDVFGAGAMMHPANTAVEGPDSPHLLVERIQRPLYAGIGEVDIIVPLEQQQPLIAELEKIDVAEVDILPTANHGYPLPGSVSYDPPSAERSWAKITALFKRELAR